MDKDQSDTITLVEFQEGLRRESVRVEFSKVGIEVPDADAFFLSARHRWKQSVGNR